MAEPIFDAPIPGNSLTKEMGNQPWKNPPQHTTLEEALDFYVDRMATDEFTDNLVNTLEVGVPVTTIANMVQLHGVMEGRHTLDVSIMLMPIIMEMIALIADSRGIEYDMGLEDEAKLEAADNDMLDLAVDKLNKKQFHQFSQEEIKQEEDLEEPDVELEGGEQQEEAFRGLMARGI